MKMILLKVLITLVALIVILLIVAFFVKKEYTLTREITIKSPVEEVYNYLRFLKNQQHHNYWLTLDPNVKIEIKGKPDGEPGSVLFFESNHKKVGAGEWKNSRLVENERIEWELQFLRPYQFTANAMLNLKRIDEHNTHIKWEFHSGMDWPKNIMLLFMDMNKMIGADIETSLSNIKQQLEN